MSKKVRFHQDYPEGYNPDWDVKRKIEFLRGMLPPAEPKSRLIKVNGEWVLEVKTNRGSDSE